MKIQKVLLAKVTKPLINTLSAHIILGSGQRQTLRIGAASKALQRR